MADKWLEESRRRDGHKGEKVWYYLRNSCPASHTFGVPELCKASVGNSLWLRTAMLWLQHRSASSVTHSWLMVPLHKDAHYSFVCAPPGCSLCCTFCTVSKMHLSMFILFSARWPNSPSPKLHQQQTPNQNVLSPAFSHYHDGDMLVLLKVRNLLYTTLMISWGVCGGAAG